MPRTGRGLNRLFGVGVEPQKGRDLLHALFLFLLNIP